MAWQDSSASADQVSPRVAWSLPPPGKVCSQGAPQSNDAPDPPGRELIWTTERPTRARLKRDGYHVIRFSRLCALILACRDEGSVRSSLKNPAAKLLALYAKRPRIAVLDVPCRTIGELWLLYGYLVEPACRRGCSLLIHADRELGALREEAFIDPDWSYPWTLERLRHLAGQCPSRQFPSWPGAVNHRRQLPAWLSRLVDSFQRRQRQAEPPSRLDPEQTAAVRAGDGVVQVIAPAGSGKTTVLIERIKELIRRGAAAERILCATFNKDAKIEIQQRLARQGIEGVVAVSFHGLGWSILKQESRLRATVGSLSFGGWRHLARQAMDTEPGGIWIDAHQAQDEISTFKLARMIPPASAIERAHALGPRERTVARLFALYERHLQDQRMLDFDDLIALTVALLRNEADLRRRWQGRFDHVLVDEYQDIEPAQVLLVGMLAAPQDSLFCVGDEDQCIYAWRRATVQRMIQLDQVYPGLERFPLVRNYRCGRKITVASRRLIAHNRHRFRKPLVPGASHAGHITVSAQPSRACGAALTAELLRDATRGQLAVLARTTTLLREVALACAEQGTGFAAAEKLFGDFGARGILEAYLRLLADPIRALPPDVDCAFRVPNRHLPPGGATRVAARLREGATFIQALSSALAGLPSTSWRWRKLAQAASLFDALAAEADAGRMVARLRHDGGLDRYFGLQERMNATECVDVEVLEEVQLAARGLSARQLAARMSDQTSTLRAHRSERGVELVTIHGAKGREWDHVILYAVDQGQLPHARSISSDAGGRGGGNGAGDRGDAGSQVEAHCEGSTGHGGSAGIRGGAGRPGHGDHLEDERRLFYVALTRARVRLDIICTRNTHSQFLAEAGLEPG